MIIYNETENNTHYNINNFEKNIIHTLSIFDSSSKPVPKKSLTSTHPNFSLINISAISRSLSVTKRRKTYNFVQLMSSNL